MVTNFDGRTAHRFRVQASKRIFYTCNTVVLFNIIIIIAVGVSSHAVAGSLA